MGNDLFFVLCPVPWGARLNLSLLSQACSWFKAFLLKMSAYQAWNTTRVCGWRHCCMPKFLFQQNIISIYHLLHVDTSVYGDSLWASSNSQQLKVGTHAARNRPLGKCTSNVKVPQESPNSPHDAQNGLFSYLSTRVWEHPHNLRTFYHRYIPVLRRWIITKNHSIRYHPPFQSLLKVLIYDTYTIIPLFVRYLGAWIILILIREKSSPISRVSVALRRRKN